MEEYQQKRSNFMACIVRGFFPVSMLEKKVINICVKGTCSLYVRGFFNSYGIYLFGSRPTPWEENHVLISLTLFHLRYLYGDPVSWTYFYMCTGSWSLSLLYCIDYFLLRVYSLTLWPWWTRNSSEKPEHESFPGRQGTRFLSPVHGSWYPEYRVLRWS